MGYVNRQDRNIIIDTAMAIGFSSGMDRRMLGLDASRSGGVGDEGD